MEELLIMYFTWTYLMLCQLIFHCTVHSTIWVPQTIIIVQFYSKLNAIFYYAPNLYKIEVRVIKKKKKKLYKRKILDVKDFKLCDRYLYIICFIIYLFLFWDRIFIYKGIHTMTEFGFSYLYGMYSYRAFKMNKMFGGIQYTALKSKYIL